MCRFCFHVKHGRKLDARVVSYGTGRRRPLADHRLLLVAAGRWSLAWPARPAGCLPVPDEVGNNEVDEVGRKLTRQPEISLFPDEVATWIITLLLD